MRIGIIGAGFVGLSAALSLAEKGHKVLVFEKDEAPGGLAIGFKDKGWRWPLEKHYHHLFTSDRAIRNLAKRVNHKIAFKRPKTSTFYNGRIYQLDSPRSLLAFSHLSPVDRVRTAVTLAYLKATPIWQPLEKITSKRFLIKTMGVNSWRILWEPLFVKKFEKWADKIPASWFWARIKKRSARLGYPYGGFENLAKTVEKRAKRMGAEFIYGRQVLSIKKKGDKLQVTTDGNAVEAFDKVICTLPNSLFCKITYGLPKSYQNKLTPLKGMGAINLVLSIKQQFFRDGTYWLNVNDVSFPFLAVVEHTNFIDKRRYNGNFLIYVGNYLSPNHRYFKMSDKELISAFLPYLARINKDFKRSSIRKSWVFKAPFAQPIPPLNYSKKVPSFETPINDLYLANIQQVYPWDRGTNYAVDLGAKVAKLL